MFGRNAFLATVRIGVRVRPSVVSAILNRVRNSVSSRRNASSFVACLNNPTSEASETRRSTHAASPALCFASARCSPRTNVASVVAARDDQSSLVSRRRGDLARARRSSTSARFVMRRQRSRGGSRGSHVKWRPRINPGRGADEPPRGGPRRVAVVEHPSRCAQGRVTTVRHNLSPEHLQGDVRGSPHFLL